MTKTRNPARYLPGIVGLALAGGLIVCLYRLRSSDEKRHTTLELLRQDNNLRIEQVRHKLERYRELYGKDYSLHRTDSIVHALDLIQSINQHDQGDDTLALRAQAWVERLETGPGASSAGPVDGIILSNQLLNRLLLPAAVVTGDNEADLEFSGEMMVLSGQPTAGWRVSEGDTLRLVFQLTHNMYLGEPLFSLAAGENIRPISASSGIFTVPAPAFDPHGENVHEVWLRPMVRHNLTGVVQPSRGSRLVRFTVTEK